MARNLCNLYFIVFLLSCQADEKMGEQRRAESQPSSVTPVDSPAPSAPAKTSAQSKPSGKAASSFYVIKEAKPSSVCGLEGFTYAWKGYIVPECGGCHYAGNKFGVTAFAHGSNVTSSFEVMGSLVDRAKFIAATQTNDFCIKCILRDGDPLLADLKFLMTNLSACPVTPNP